MLSLQNQSKVNTFNRSPSQKTWRICSAKKRGEFTPNSPQAKKNGRICSTAKNGAKEPIHHPIEKNISKI
jgi:hypothetical protein